MPSDNVPTEAAPAPPPSRRLKKRRNPSLKFWAVQLTVLYRFVIDYNKLLYKSNKRFLSKGVIDSEDQKTLQHIENVGKLISTNISSLLNRFLLLLLILVSGILVMLFMRLPSTLVKVDVKVSSVEWRTDSTSIDPQRFNVFLVSHDANTFSLEKAEIQTAPFSLEEYGQLDFDLKYGLRIEKMQFPKSVKVRLENMDTTGMNLIVTPPLLQARGFPLSFDMVFPEADIYSGSLPGFLRVGGRDSNNVPLRMAVKNDLDSGKQYRINLRHLDSWQWPPGIWAKEVSFNETDAANSKPISSIMEGKINLLETNDSAIQLSQRDVLRTTFTDPVELYLRGDSSGIYVHLEGEVSQIEFGPRIMEGRNNRMPILLKVISEKTPYIWVFITIIISIITVVKIRGR